MKEIKLFVDFEFTSLSPDAQPISVGIVCENKAFITPVKDETQNDIISNFCVGSFRQDFSGHSFYAEFTDFDISRCDDWVKENVVDKLQFYPESHDKTDEYDTQVWDMCNRFENVKIKLRQWLSQFSDYKIQFVVDCGTWDWYWLLQLLAEWEIRKFETDNANEICEILNEVNIICGSQEDISCWYKKRIGLPKLPDNISPVPMDLNDLIAFKKGISVSEAFDLNREFIAGVKIGDAAAEKHNALWDAKVIKTIYEQLNS